MLLLLSSFVGKSIYCKNRRYNLSYGRYISKNADIFGVAADIFEKRRYNFKHYLQLKIRGSPNGNPPVYAAITSKTVPVLASTKIQIVLVYHLTSL